MRFLGDRKYHPKKKTNKWREIERRNLASGIGKCENISGLHAATVRRKESEWCCSSQEPIRSCLIWMRLYRMLNLGDVGE